eukprot:m.14567 g.14567  ORF g.14567 m.14567 type:complete len:884 (-) comp10206_c0_seq1:73-2724(-)
MAGPLPIGSATLQPNLGMMTVVTRFLKQALTSHNTTNQEVLLRTLLSKVVITCNSVDVSTLNSSGLPALLAEVISLVPNPATKLGSIALGMLGGSPRVRLAILHMMEDRSNPLTVQRVLLHNKVLSPQGIRTFSILLHRMRGDSEEIQTRWKSLLATELSQGVNMWHIPSISLQSLGGLSSMIMGYLDVSTLTNAEYLKQLLITVPMRLSADPNNSIEYEGAEAIGDLAAKLWKSEDALHLVFTQLGALSVKNLLGIAPFMRRIPMSLVKEASTKVVENDALHDDVIIVLGRNMLLWTTWPTPTTQGSMSQINFWPATFVHALIAQKRVKVLVELVNTTSAQLLLTIEATADIAAMSVLKSLLSGYQSDPKAFHSLVPFVPRVLETLAKVNTENAKPTKHSIVSKWLRLLMSKLLFLFPGYSLLYEDLVKCLGEERPLSKRERELLFESAWDGSRTVSFVWRHGDAKEVFLLGLSEQGWKENGRKLMKKDDGSNWSRHDVCIWAQENNLDDALFWNNNIDGKSLARIDDAMLEKTFGLQNNLERANYLNQLKKISGDYFRVSVRLVPGSYEFKFLVDGVFKFDGELPNMKSAINTINNTLTLAQISETNTSALQERVPGKVGLSNLINTCYLNSVTQALFSTPMFQNELLRKGITAYSQKLQPYDATSSMVACIDLFMTLKLSKRHFVSPQRFLDRCRPPWFQAGTQQDSTEFLSYFFDQLEAASLKRIEIESKPTQVQLITTISEVPPSLPQAIPPPPTTTVAPPTTPPTTTTTTASAAAITEVATPQPTTTTPQPTTATTTTEITTPPPSTPTVHMSTPSTSPSPTPMSTSTSSSPSTSTPITDASSPLLNSDITTIITTNTNTNTRPRIINPPSFTHVFE